MQLLGALRMLAGDVIEMATGEGKTLAGAIAAAGYALAGRHVHVVTINDYLARRDAEWMGPLMRGDGPDGRLDHRGIDERRNAAPPTTATSPTPRSTRSASTYCATSWSPTSPTWCRRNPDVALIDEADSVLVDEALVPLVLAGTTHRETPRLEIIQAGRRAGRSRAPTTTPTPTAATCT